MFGNFCRSSPEELKSYIDRKHREMEELLAESEGRLSEQLREHNR